jgi:ribose transport system ATP-binding protein
VNVSIEHGEIPGGIGENGAGKSTFMKILSGIYQPTSGTLRVSGREIAIRDPVTAKKAGIVMIPQEFNLVNTLMVFENLFLGYELRKSSGLLDKSTMRKKAEEVLQKLNTDIDPEAKILTLSVAQKQMVEIGKALVHDSKVLIMDEPTTVLNSQEVETLFRIMRQLKASGVSMLFISHKLKEVKTICDRVLILRDGNQVGLESIENLTTDEMAQRMVGRELNQIFPDKSKNHTGIPVLQVENLSVEGLLHDISFTLHKGEILGFAGLMGAGRTELAETIMGLRHRQSGKITVNQSELKTNDLKQAIQHKIAYLSEDRQGRGLIMNFTIPENISLVSLGFSRRLFLDKKNESAAAADYTKKFNIRAASMNSEVRYLSGGNQQKVYLAKWMDTKPDILILDEPTRGIDVNARMEIYQFIKNLSDSGIACIVISSEQEEVIGLCTRILVMREGHITGHLTHQDITEEEIMYYATGIKAEKGIPLKRSGETQYEQVQHN